MAGKIKTYNPKEVTVSCGTHITQAASVLNTWPPFRSLMRMGNIPSPVSRSWGFR